MDVIGKERMAVHIYVVGTYRRYSLAGAEIVERLQSLVQSGRIQALYRRCYRCHFNPQKLLCLVVCVMLMDHYPCQTKILAGSLSKKGTDTSEDVSVPFLAAPLCIERHGIEKRAIIKAINSKSGH